MSPENLKPFRFTELLVFAVYGFDFPNLIQVHNQRIEYAAYSTVLVYLIASVCFRRFWQRFQQGYHTLNMYCTTHERFPFSQISQDGGGSAPDGRDDGGGGGQGEEGEGGEWRPDLSGGEGKGEGQGNDKRRRPDAPNPFR